MACHGRGLLGLILSASMTSAAIAAPQGPPVFRSIDSQFTLLSPIDPTPNTAIRALDGSMTELGRFHGRVVVLNFWASWCLPCAYEMPSLDKLAATSDSRHFAVIAVSIDQAGAAAVAPFIAIHHLRHLAIYLDPHQRLGTLDVDHVAVGALPLWGLPITYILDADGRVIGYLTGAAKWDSPEAATFLDYFLKRTAP